MRCPCLSAVRSGRTLASVAAVALPDEEAEREKEEQEERAAQQANWSEERIIAEGLVGKLVQQWQGPISTLARAGKAFDGLEALLGGAQGGSFDLGVSSAFLLLLSYCCFLTVAFALLESLSYFCLFQHPC